MDRSLSKNEAKLVLDLEWRGQKFVTLPELQAALGASANYARFIAHRLVQKAWLERVRPGLFQLIPADRGREGVADANPLTAGAALAAPYFFSFGTACTHHGLTEQVFAEVYIACREHHRPMLIRGKRYVLVSVPEQRFFGFEETLVLGQPVMMATPERAIIDALDRPQYAGGIGEVSHIVEKAARRLSWERLLDLLQRWDESALVQRLGYFLDLHQADLVPTVREEILKLVRPHSKVHLGARKQWGASGRLVRPWNIVENVPHDVLIEPGTRRTRRVPFRPKAKM